MFTEKDKRLAKNYTAERALPSFETNRIFVRKRITDFVLQEVERAFLAGLNVYKPKWHELNWEKDYPKSDSLVRVRTKSGEEYICETYDYQPTEDEIGYGHIITQFGQLDGNWVDDNEIEYWCYIEPFKE